MKKILYCIVSFLAAVSIADLLVKQEAYYGDALRDAVAFILFAFCFFTLCLTAYFKIEEIERKQAKKRNNEIIYLEAETRKDIEKKETA